MQNGTQKGRGSGSNATGRFEQLTVEYDEEFPRSLTSFFKDHSKTILTRNQSPDIPFAVSVNPYRGCEHGCVYCYARPTHEYLGYSAGIDFESKILVKEDAPILLRKKLESKRYVPEVITFSGVTDCYQPAERKFRLTRRCLEVLAEFGNPFTIISKNHLVTRDIDLIAPMARKNAAAVFITITSLDEKLISMLEPRTSRPSARLSAIRELSEAGIPVGVMVAPVIPGLTDHEMPRILQAAAEAGATGAGYVPLRLPHGVAQLFSEWLENHFPDRKQKVLNRIRSMRGGKLNNPEFGERMRGEGEFAQILQLVFRSCVKKHHLNQSERNLTVEHFRRPSDSSTYSLFPG